MSATAAIRKVGGETLPTSTATVASAIRARPIAAPVTITRRRNRAAVRPTGTAIQGSAGLWPAPERTTPPASRSSVNSRLEATTSSGCLERAMRRSSVRRLTAEAANRPRIQTPNQGSSAIRATPIAAARNAPGSAHARGVVEHARAVELGRTKPGGNRLHGSVIGRAAESVNPYRRLARGRPRRMDPGPNRAGGAGVPEAAASRC